MLRASQLIQTTRCHTQPMCLIIMFQYLALNANILAASARSPCSIPTTHRFGAASWLCTRTVRMIVPATAHLDSNAKTGGHGRGGIQSPSHAGRTAFAGIFLLPAGHPRGGPDPAVRPAWLHNSHGSPTVADDILGPGSMVICRPTSSMSIGRSKYTVPFSLGAVITDADAEGSDAIAEMMLMPHGVIQKGVARR